jgi:hypothetical protein
VRLVVALLFTLGSAGCITRPVFTFYDPPKPRTITAPAERCYDRRAFTLVGAGGTVAWRNVDVQNFGAYARVTVTSGSNSLLGVAFHQEGAVVPANRAVREIGDPGLIEAQRAIAGPLRARWSAKLATALVGWTLFAGGAGMMLGALTYDLGDNRFTGLVAAGATSFVGGAVMALLGTSAIKTIGGEMYVAEMLFTNGREARRLVETTAAHNRRVAAECGFDPSQAPPLAPEPPPPPPPPLPSVAPPPPPPPPAAKQNTDAFD